jgi:hypothetical protein
VKTTSARGGSRQFISRVGPASCRDQRLLDSQIDFSHGKTCDLEAEIELDCREFVQDLAEQPLIPRREFSQAIVRDAEGPRLFGREVLDPDYRDLSPPKPLQAEQPAMSGQDLVFAVDQNRDDGTEGSDALCDLLDLPSAMLLWVPRVWFELADRQPLDFEVSSSILRHLVLLTERPRRARVRRLMRRTSGSRLARLEGLLGA